MSNEPLVTVVSPIYNGEKHVRACAECMLAQTYTNWRYVILDNHSTDGTGAIAADCASRDGRIRVVRNPETYPVIRNHNEAFRQAETGSVYFRFLQADDRITPDCLEASVAVAERHPSAGIVGSQFLWGDKVTATEFPEGEFFAGHDTARRTLLGHVYPFLTPSGLLWRMQAVQAREPLWDERYLYADVMACYEILREWDFGYVPRALTVAGRDANSVTSQVTGSFNKMLASNLHLLVMFGPGCLEEELYEKRVAQQLAVYYAYLGQSWWHRRLAAFWDFHAAELRGMGFPLSKWRVRRNALRYLRAEPGDALSQFARSFTGDRT
ncbi:MAG: glycosyltransferase family 2 protein [Pseudomonadales bacterium]|nr:glycosyltransferase family 2 protein [Pseudomonadales bacterium]MCP5182987.1 glycosyltransferase family 2 protein [Pseudomonadales bacterium]